MGFPSIFPCSLAPKSLGVLVVMLDLMRLLVAAPLFYLGLYSAVDFHTLLPPIVDPDASNGADQAYRLSSGDLPVPLLIPPPSSIKRRLRVVQFQKIAAATSATGPGNCNEREEEEGVEKEEHKREHVCAVCLCELAAEDEVRELGNCRHVFHLGCIDRWVDEGQITCPLCRAMLLPRSRERRDQAAAESSSHLPVEEIPAGGRRRRG